MRPSMDYGREEIVRFLYIEPIMRDQRVLVLGPEKEVVKEILQRMGCRSVKLFMPGKEPGPDWDLAFLRGKRDASEESRRIMSFSAGSFDIVFIPDIAEIGDYRMALLESARVAGENGIVLISARNAECTVAVSQSGLEETPDIWSLKSLLDLASGYFKFVENVGQCPFLAYALVSYDPERALEGVRLDTSLMGERSEEPEFFLLLCSQKPSGMKLSNAIYQVPLSETALVEAPEVQEVGEAQFDDRSLRAEIEMLKKDVSEKNVLVSRLKKELERVEAEAEERRQKMFEMKQAMERERKSVQKEVLEKAIQKQVERIPETWMAEREAMVREAQQLKKENEILSGENRKLEGEVERLAMELKEKSEKISREIEKERPLETEKLHRALSAKEKLIRDLLQEMEMMPQVGYGEDVPAGEEDVLEIVGRVEEMKRRLQDEEKARAGLVSQIQDLRLTLDEERLESAAVSRDNAVLKDRVKELAAAVEMLSEIKAADELRDLGEKGGLADAVERLEAVIRFSLDGIRRLAEKTRGENLGRDVALLWAKIEERRRMAVPPG